jgi:putative ABC transport system ATP-binding protein
MRDLAKRDGMPILLVTHDPRILDIADRVIAMEDGRITDGAA